MVNDSRTAERCRLAVLDANFYWTEQLFSACSDFADVLLLKPRDFKSFRQQHGRLFFDYNPRPVSEGVWEQRTGMPPGWLFHYWPLTKKALAWLIKRHQQDEPLIFVFSYPYYYSLAKDLNCKSIYYSIDDYSTYWPGRESQTERVERMAVEQADMTLCVSAHRAAHLRQYAHGIDKIVHLPHGCSPDFMVEKPLPKPVPLPNELQKYSRPVAGYVGALNGRFDFQYLFEVARLLPEITFVLGGEMPQSHDGPADWWEGVHKAKSLSNVHLIGSVPHARLGEYLHSFDVLLMLYSQCKFNSNACPMKLWDYMGTSLPVVANNAVPEVNQWSEVIHVSTNPAEFASKVKVAVSTPGWQSARRLEIARHNTWKKQGEKLRHMLQARGWLGEPASEPAFGVSQLRDLTQKAS